MAGRLQPQAGDLLKLDWGDGTTDRALVLEANTATRRLRVRYTDGEVLAMNMDSAAIVDVLRREAVAD